MLIRHERFVGFRCPECSSVNIKQISVFDFSGNKKITLGCSCKASYIGITDKGNRYLVAAPCVACYERHFFTVKKNALWSKKVLCFHCPVTMLGIFCIGEYDEVVKQMGEFDTQTAELLESYHIDPMEGSGDEYVDEDIMFDAVEYIYSLVYSGKVSCSCANNELMFQLKPDRISISCRACGRSKEIMADSEDALTALYSMEEIKLI